MDISELGEFGLIDRLRAILGQAPEGEEWIGDDTAVLRAPAGTILFTSDMLVEGVHFDLELTGPADLGYKSIAVNMSDVAAMSGTPRRAVVSLGLRAGLQVDWVEDLCRGMKQCCDEFDSAVAGGDLSRSDCLVISVALIGNPAGRRVTLRRGARPGDAVCVTGTLGRSAAGYRLLRAGIKGGGFGGVAAPLGTDPRAPEAANPPKSTGEDLKLAHLRPTPRVREAEVLRRHLPTAMIDVSDGFAADLGHLCDSSGVGVVISAADMPLPNLDNLSLDKTALDLALAGGEDYELCFTIPQDRFDKAASEVVKATGTPVTRVGEIVDQARGRILLIEGDEHPLEVLGWDHLRV